MFRANITGQFMDICVNKKKVALPGFEPGLSGSKPEVLDH